MKILKKKKKWWISKQNTKVCKSKGESASPICIVWEKKKWKKKLLQTDDLLWFKTSQLFLFWCKANLFTFTLNLWGIVSLSLWNTKALILQQRITLNVWILFVSDFRVLPYYSPAIRGWIAKQPIAIIKLSCEVLSNVYFNIYIHNVCMCMYYFVLFLWACIIFLLHTSASWAWWNHNWNLDVIVFVRASMLRKYLCLYASLERIMLIHTLLIIVSHECVFE